MEGQLCQECRRDQKIYVPFSKAWRNGNWWDVPVLQERRRTVGRRQAEKFGERIWE
jgi:hypothetical protein